ncbi:MAG TPA: FHA domain-containing protein [Nocardioidaceae bacterium]|nr:FHA domain-containing protein [Nocardioidaceae bacterium]
MSEFTLTLIKLGFLALLWIFVLSAVSVIRSDMFGARVDAPPKGQRGRQPKAAKQPKPAKPPKEKKKRRGSPSQLVIVDGPNSGASVQLTGEPVTLGRGGDSTIKLDDDYVSTRHARFVTNGDDWFVEDLGSTNGTYLGNTRVTRAVAVSANTAVRLGKTVVELRK